MARRHPASAGRRHRGRELALRVLFELEGTSRDAADALDYQVHDLGAPDDVADFARRLVDGTLGDMQRIERAISDASEHWRLEDIGKVERAVLRLGTYELLHERATPAAVVIDESVELAKAYVGEEGGRFVNGVLGRIAGERV